MGRGKGSKGVKNNSKLTKFQVTFTFHSYEGMGVQYNRRKECKRLHPPTNLSHHFSYTLFIHANSNGLIHSLIPSILKIETTILISPLHHLYHSSSLNLESCVSNMGTKFQTFK